MNNNGPTIEQILADKKFIEFLKGRPEFQEEYVRLQQTQASGGIITDIWLISTLISIYKFFFGGGQVAAISILSPLVNHPVNADEKSKVVVAISQSDFWTLLQNCVVIIRNKNGQEVWQGSGRFHHGNCEIESIWPKEPGIYSVEASAFNLIGQVVTLTTAEITVQEKPKDEKDFHTL